MKTIFYNLRKSAVLFMIMSLFFVGNAFGQNKLYSRSIKKILFLLILVGSITQLNAQIAQRGNTTNISTNSSLTIDKPAGLVEGDIMFANIVQSDNDNSTLANATITGWTLVAGEEFGNVGNDSWWGTILYKVATVTDVAATDFTFTGDNDADDMLGGIVAFSGVAVTGGVSGGPFDVAPGTINNINTDDFSATAITTVTNNAAVIMFGMIGDNRNIDSWTATSPATLTELFDIPFDANADMGVGVAWNIKTNTGSTGIGLGELSANENDPNGAILIALRAAPKQFRSAGTGNWGTAATWQESTDGANWATATAAPTSADGLVTIRNGHTVTLAANATASNLTIDVGGTLNTGVTFTFGVTGASNITGTMTLAGTGAKTFTGDVDINAGGVWNETGVSNYSFVGNFINDATTFTANTGVHTFSGTAKTFSGATTTTIGSVAVTGTYTNNGTLTVGTALSGAGTLTNSSTGTLNVNGTCSVTTLTNNGNITSTGTRAITSTTITNNLNWNMDGTGTVTAFTNAANGVLSISATPTIPTFTALTTSAAGNTVNYDGLGAQTVRVNAYSNLILSGSGAKTCAVTTVSNDFTLSGTATVTHGATLAITRDLLLNGGTFTTGNFTLSVGRNLALSGGNLTTTGAFACTVTGTTTITSGTLTLPVSAGNKTFTGLVTLNGGTLTGASATVVLGSGITNTSGTVTLTGTATMNTTAATFGGTISIATVSVNTGVAVTNNGTLTFGTALSGAGTLTNSSTGTLNLNGTCSVTTLTNNGNITSTGTGAITSTTITNNLNWNMDGTGRVNAFTNAAAGVLNISATPTVPTFTALTTSAAGNTVNYNATGAQTVKAAAYSNLTLSGSGIKTFAGIINPISGDFSIGSGVQANLGGFTNIGHTLILNGISQSKSGTWGAEGATNIDATYFTGPGTIQIGSTITTGGSGNWSSKTNNAPWPNGIVPGAADIVTIINDGPTGYTVTVDIANAVCKTLNIAPITSARSVLAFNNLTQLTVNGIVTLGNSGQNNRIGTLNMTNTGKLLCQGFALANAGTNTFTSGTGTVELTATNTLPATIFTTFNNLIISGGTTTLAANINSTASTGSLTVNAGATLNLSTFTFGATTSIPSTTLQCGGISTGGTISGTGALTLGGNVTVIDSGDGPAGATISCPVALGATRTFTIADDLTAAADLTVSGVISTAAGIIKAGAGTMVLSGVNTYSGTTTLNAGVLSISAANNIGTTGGLVFNSGATLRSTGTNVITISKSIILNTGGGGTFDIGIPIYLSGAISGGGGIATSGNDLILNRSGGTNTVGSISINGGRLFVQNSLTNISGSSINVADGAILDIDINATNSLTNTITFASGAGLANRQGTLSISTANATFPTGGTMIFNKDDLPTTAITVNNNYPGLTSNLTLQVGGINSTVGNVTFSGIISGPFGITKTSTGRLILSGTNSYSGGTSISDGALTIGSTSALGSTSGAFSISGTGTATVSSNVTVGSLTIGGLGTASGTWGSSDSSATYKSSVFFSTGLVTVGTDTRATPTITTAPSATAITYGQTLASSTLSGGVASVAGTFAFTTPSTAPNAGTASQSVTFTPTDAANYNTASTSASVTVNKATPTITSLGSTSGCVGTSIIINGTNLSEATAENVEIGGTPVSSITSNSATQIVAVIGSGTTGKVTVTNSAGTAISTSDFIVNPNLPASVSVGATATTICSGASVTFTATPTNGGAAPSYQWYKGSTAISGETVETYTSTTLVNSDVIKVIMTSDATCATGSPVTSNTVTMTVNPTSVGGTATATALTVCPGSGTTISVTGYTGTIQWQQSADGSSWANVSGGSVGATATYTTPNLTVTTYYKAVVTSGVCASALSTTATVTVNSSNTWIGGTIHSSWFTASNWSCGSIPTATSDVIIQNGSQLIVDDTSTTALANTITVSANSSLTVNSGNTLKVTDKVTNDGGTITFEDTASLVQTNPDAVNFGNILYKRTTSILANNYDFVYWSSPVAAQQIGTIWMASNWADTFYNFNSAGNNWARTYAANEMIPGKGYIARARNGQQGWDYNNNVSTFTVGGAWNAKFSGVPNNGTITVTDCVAGKYCLLGNPYPSALDADEFLDINSAVLEGTLYFWTHTTPMINNAYNSNDYASYNTTGSVRVGNIGIGGENMSNRPSGKIAAGQSFFATAKGTANVIFNNTMRVGAGGAPLANNQFFRTSSAKAKTANSIEKHRLWLNVSNTQGAFKQTLVGYVTDATNAYDSRFDGESFGGNTYVDFYSINENKNLTIQGRALPFDENDTVPLGFKTTIAGSFTIDIDEVDGLLANQTLYLEDKLTNTVSNLKNGDYTFTTAKGTFNDRFVLRYTYKTLGLNDTDKTDGILVFYSNNYKTLIIKNNVMDAIVNSVVLFNTTGQRIANFDIIDSGQTNLQIPIKNIASGIYIVKVKTTKGESSKKVIVN